MCLIRFLLSFAIAAFSALGLGSTVVAVETNSIPTGGKAGVPTGFKIIEGDILVPESYPLEGPTQNATPLGDPNYLWANGMVPFEFDGSVNSTNRQKMRDAMAEWEAVATVTFVSHTDELNWLYIIDSDFNASWVGRFPVPGPQLVHITSWDFRFLICHELGHALGFEHEQGRPDRDDFVRIETNNISLIDLPQFDKHPEAKKYGPYDFDSVMHYPECAFSECGSQNCADAPTAACRTITVLPPNTAQQSQIGQRDHLSFWDQRIMSFLYPRSNWRFVDATAGLFGFGSFYFPFWFLTTAVSDVPTGGTLWLLQPGPYVAPATITKRMTLRAPLGGAVLTR